MVWSEPRFGHGRVDAAGKALVEIIPNREPSQADRDRLSWAFGVVDNWRSSHSYPLQVAYMNLRTRARAVDPDALVAQRLKRLHSIYVKLKSEKTMKLSQMQDIGGCRAVMTSIAQLESLVRRYDVDLASFERDRARKQQRADRSLIVEKYDYIARPKDDGYRGVHFVCKYQTENTVHRVHNSMRVEVQIRSRVQHLWATAVEVAQTFTRQALRSRSGNRDWRRFFALMGSALAAREELPRVPDTPEDLGALKAELHKLVEDLQVSVVLSAYGEAAEIVTRSAARARRFLLELDPDRRELRVSPFRGDDMQEAMATLFKAERGVDDKTLRVLVSVDSISALRRAYPNYYLDTTQFLEAVASASA